VASQFCASCASCPAWRPSALPTCFPLRDSEGYSTFCLREFEFPLVPGQLNRSEYYEGYDTIAPRHALSREAARKILDEMIADLGMQGWAQGETHCGLGSRRVSPQSTSPISQAWRDGLC
jgi:hypothetical protein